MIDLKKYLRHDKNKFQLTSHNELAEIAFAYMEAYKRILYDKKDYKDSLERKVDNLIQKVETLTTQLEKNKDYEKLYKTLRIRKLSLKERLCGKIIEIQTNNI